jgi:uncharacterized membrane protein YkvA (DUF1232 family)
VIKTLYRRGVHEIRTYRWALNDSRTPRAAKWLLHITFGYLLSPIDLIPDAIPVLGFLDDLVVVPALLLMVRWLIPHEIWADCRLKAISSPPPSGLTAR